jgi:hypothetical protein
MLNQHPTELQNDIGDEDDDHRNHWLFTDHFAGAGCANSSRLPNIQYRSGYQYHFILLYHLTSPPVCYKRSALDMQRYGHGKQLLCSVRARIQRHFFDGLSFFVYE